MHKQVADLKSEVDSLKAKLKATMKKQADQAKVAQASKIESSPVSQRLWEENLGLRKKLESLQCDFKTLGQEKQKAVTERDALIDEEKKHKVEISELEKLLEDAVDMAEDRDKQFELELQVFKEQKESYRKQFQDEKSELQRKIEDLRRHVKVIEKEKRRALRERDSLAEDIRVVRRDFEDLKQMRDNALPY